MAFKVHLIPQVFWRCPICHEEESISVRSEGILFKRHFVVCGACGAKWKDISEKGMTLVEGPSEQLGMKTLDEWAQLASGLLTIKTLDNVQVPILLKKGEGVVKVGRAVLYQEKTRRTRPSRPYAGVSFRVARGIRIHTGSLFPDSARTITETVPADEGEFILTNKRLVFNGNKKPISMDLTKIIAVDVEAGFLEVGYCQRTYLFQFPSESLLKWETYIRGVGELAVQGGN